MLNYSSVISKKEHHYFSLFIVLIVLLLCTTKSFAITYQAGPYCTFNFTPGNSVIDISGTVSPGADLPAGTVLYSFPKIASEMQLTSAACSSTPTGQDVVLVMFMEPITGVTIPGGVGGYSAISTSVPGIAMAAESRSVGTPGLPNPSPAPNWPYSSVAARAYTGGSARQASPRLIYRMISTSSQNLPTQIVGSSLPTFRLYLRAYNTVSGTPVTNAQTVDYGTVSFTGTLNVVPLTCQTPDEIVFMGTKDIKSFSSTAIGGTMDWVDASFTLTNCPASVSGYNGGGQMALNGTITPLTPTVNRLEYKISPVYGAYDANQGIINLQNTTGSASGVGIQIAKGTVDLNSVQPLNTIVSNTLTTYGTGSTLKIPLVARYYKTSASTTPGTVNSAVSITISYM